jgi:uncharacterized hydrophobic protein (TIGR00341 family)
MTLRLIEILLPERDLEHLESILKSQSEVIDAKMQQAKGVLEYPVLGLWKQQFSSEQVLIKILIEAEKSEILIDRLSNEFSGEDGFRINVLPVLATVPRATEEDVSKKFVDKKTEKEKSTARISREELYDNLESAAKSNYIYATMIILSSVVAAVGIINNNVTILIGAMVMAPLLGPNVALSLASTLGDAKLARNALKSIILGILLATIVSVLIGLIQPINPLASELVMRTRVGLNEVIVAVAAGCAGVLSFTAAVPGILIGVTVAVSLLPPLIAFGLLIGSGQIALAFNALLLFLMNIICINLAGVATFLAQGIEPRTWWDAKKAKRVALIVLSIWILLLLILIIIILLFGFGS